MDVILILGIGFPNTSVWVVYLASYVDNKITYLIYSAKINNNFALFISLQERFIHRTLDSNYKLLNIVKGYVC